MSLGSLDITDTQRTIQHLVDDYQLLLMDTKTFFLFSTLLITRGVIEGFYFIQIKNHRVQYCITHCTRGLAGIVL